MNEVNSIVFYNEGHNGDVHYSREFVKYITKNIPIPYTYNIRCDESILKNSNIVVNKENCKNILHKYRQEEIVYFEKEKILLINAWIGSSNAKFIWENEAGCSLTANFNKYSQIFNKLNIKILNPVDYIPEMSWENCDTDQIDNFLQNYFLEKTILICNGPVKSGQSENIDLNPIVEKLANLNPKVLFILTDSERKINKNNVVYTSDIIKINGSDLNEIAYIGTKSDIIVGRASGPFCFCHNKATLFDPTKTFLAFTYYKNDGLWALPEQLPEKKAKQVWSNKFDFDSVCDTINKELNQ